MDTKSLGLGFWFQLNDVHSTECWKLTLNYFVYGPEFLDLSQNFVHFTLHFIVCMFVLHHEKIRSGICFGISTIGQIIMWQQLR